MCTPATFSPTATQMAAIRRGALTRRSLLRAAGIGALALGTRGVVGARPATAQTVTDAGICVPTERVSIQLYTLREMLAADLEGTVAALAAVGYRRVEHAGTDAAESPEAFRAVFDAHGIAITSGHRNVPFPYDEEQWQAVLEESLVLGCTRINEPLPPFLLPDLVLATGGSPVGTVSSVQYAQYADAANRAGEAAKAVGIQLGYHNHNPEFLLLPDDPTRKGYDVLLAETDPELVDFEMDVYWVTAGGEDPLARLQAHAGRFGQLHVKDMAEDGSITFPGTGIIDFGPIVAEAAAQGVDEYIIEQDNAGAEAVRSAELGWALLTGGCPATAPTPTVERVAGGDRTATAAALSARTFATGVPVAYAASAGGFADALAGGPAAAAEGGPLLLTATDALSPATRAELERLAPQRIVGLGGPAAVSDAVVDERRALPDGDVVRRAGDDRYATAAAVSAVVFTPGAARVAVATGEDFPDALAGGAAGAAERGPLLLTTRDALPEATREELERLAPAAITVLGGDDAVSDAVVAELEAIAPTTRAAGASRYETAAAAAAGFTATGGTVLVATGEAFPDALAATAAAGTGRHPVVLVQRDGVPAATRNLLARLRPAQVLVLGGTAAVADAVLDELRTIVSGA